MLKGKAGNIRQRFHAVQFYQDDDSLVTVVVKFLAEGLRQSQPGVVVATLEHRNAIDDALLAQGLDVGRMKRFGDLVLLDARETLDTIVADDLPHPELFNHVFGSALGALARMHPNRPIRAYGEMVDLLWQSGRMDAAVRVEILWNQLVQSGGVSLLCGYAIGNFYKETSAFEAICRAHTHVIGSNVVAFDTARHPPAPSEGT